MPYKPGLHILAEFKSENNVLLSASNSCKIFFDELIIQYDLKKVGEAYHDFENGGFTAVICLTESHLSIHTWPEFQMATFDVFLSNYQKENDEKARNIYEDVIAFFDAVTLNKNEIKR